MIRVVVLGTGGAMPSKEHLPNSMAVKYGGTFVFDCCEGAQQQFVKYGLSYLKMPAIFLSHLHADHFLGVFGLIQTCNLQQRQEPLTIYGPKGLKEFFGAALSLRHFQPNFPVMLQEVSDGEVYRNDLFTVSCFPVEHNTPSVGYVLIEQSHRRYDLEKVKKAGAPRNRLSELQERGWILVGKKKVTYQSVSYEQTGKKVVYSGDTKACKRLEKEAKGADLLIHDSCFLFKDKELADAKKHCTSKEAAQIAKKAKVKKLLLTHFSNRYDDRQPLLDEAQAVFKETAMAVEGLELLV